MATPSDKTEISKELSRIEESAMHSAQNQFEQTKIWRVLQIWIALPATALAAILAVGTGGSLLAEVVSKEFAGAMVLVAAGLGSIAAWLKAADKADACEISGNEYLAIQNAARVAQKVDIPEQTFAEARDRLKELSEQRDAANRQAPLPSRLARRRANKNIESGSQQYRADAE